MKWSATGWLKQSTVTANWPQHLTTRVCVLGSGQVALKVCYQALQRDLFNLLKYFLGILCTANGIKKAAFFTDSVMETRTNAKTSSDFNDRVSSSHQYWWALTLFDWNPIHANAY